MVRKVLSLWEKGLRWHRCWDPLCPSHFPPVPPTPLSPPRVSSHLTGVCGDPLLIQGCQLGRAHALLLLLLLWRGSHSPNDIVPLWGALPKTSTEANTPWDWRTGVSPTHRNEWRDNSTLTCPINRPVTYGFTFVLSSVRYCPIPSSTR